MSFGHATLFHFCSLQEQRAFGVDGLRYKSRPQKHQHRQTGHHDNQNDSCHPYGSPREEKEEETSGYASDSVEATVTSLQGDFSKKPKITNYIFITVISKNKLNFQRKLILVTQILVSEILLIIISPCLDA